MAQRQKDDHKKTIGRKIVFFIGAGASYGAGSFATVQGGGELRIPIQDAFWDTFLRFCSNSERRKRIEAFLFRYFLNYTKVPARWSAAQRRRAVRSVDVEEVFTFLSERIQAPGTTLQLRTYAKQIWDDLVSEIGFVFGRFGANPSTRSLYKLFLHNHVRNRDAIASFNYDTVFERSLPGKRKRYYVGVSPRKSGLRIIKPHGSINWSVTDAKVVENPSPERSFIVAPTHLKFVGNMTEKDGYFGLLNTSQEITKIWEEMEREMRAAKAFVFIGYSFPVADLYFSSVFRSVLASRETDPAVFLVNPDSVDIQRRLRSRFSLKRVFNYFDMETFFRLSRNDILKRVE